MWLFYFLSRPKWNHLAVAGLFFHDGFGDFMLKVKNSCKNTPKVNMKNYVKQKFYQKGL